MNAKELREVLVGVRKQIARTPRNEYSRRFCPVCILSEKGLTENKDYLLWSPSGNGGHSFTKANSLAIVDNSIAAIDAEPARAL